MKEQSVTSADGLSAEPSMELIDDQRNRVDGAFFVTEGDTTSPQKQPRAEDEDGPLLEEYFQPAIERGASVGSNQGNDDSFRGIVGVGSLEPQQEQQPLSETRRDRRHRKKAQQAAIKREEARSKMAFSANNPAGLPSDAFDDFLDSGGLTVGVNYLRTLKHVKTVGAEKVDLYGNLQVAKRRPSTSSMVHHHHAPKEEGNSPPTSPVQRVRRQCRRDFVKKYSQPALYDGGQG